MWFRCRSNVDDKGVNVKMVVVAVMIVILLNRL